MVYETELGYENPKKIINDANVEQLEQAAFDMFVQQTMLRAGQILQQPTPQQQTEIDRLMPQASPVLQQALQGNGAAPAQMQGPAPVVEAPGNVRQALANEARTGVPINPRIPGVTG